MQAKPLTESAFILSTNDGERFGILLKKQNEIQLVTSDNINIFTDISDLENLLGSEIHFSSPVSHVESKNTEVNGYPVKHEEVFEVETGNITTYKSSPNSKTKWVPGWWGIRFTRGYIAFFCPKLATLIENEYVGPFKNKFDAEHTIKIRNQEIRAQEQ